MNEILRQIENAIINNDSRKLTKLGEILEMEMTGVELDERNQNRLVDIFSNQKIYKFDEGCMQLMMAVTYNRENFFESIYNQYLKSIESNLNNFAYFGPLFYACEVVFLNFNEISLKNYLLNISLTSNPMYLAALPNAIEKSFKSLDSQNILDFVKTVLEKLSKHNNQHVSQNATQALARIG